MMRIAAAVTAALAACWIAGSWAAEPAPREFVPRAFGSRPSVDQMATLGEQIFNDPGLSASGRLACASCHDPAHAFGPPNRLSAQLGGADMKHQGFRNPPSLMYLQTSIPFTEHFIDDEDGHGIDAGPTGGLTWDGRAASPAEQAAIPLFSAHEMANTDVASLANRLRRSAYAGEFQQAFSTPGQNVFDDPARVVGWLTKALEVYQQSPSVFYPYTSKFDAVLRHQATFTAQEERGLALFNNPDKGNCASCHPSAMQSGGGFPLLSDAGHIALGVPRNMQLAANRDPRFFDLGLCGPERTDLKGDADLCGRFKAPSLRNVAARGSYFHNGRFQTLREVIEFYVQRDIAPARWYPRGRDGRVQKFDDLPARYRSNVNTEAPFAPVPGNRPRLSAREIDDMIVFLKTLSDGYNPVDEQH